MATTQNASSTGGLPLPVRGRTIGGIVVALLSLIHLFVLQLGGVAGWLLLLVIWPLVGGIVAAYLELGVTRPSDLPIVGGIAGFTGAIITVLVIFLTGLAGAWSSFIFDSFGVELAPVVIAFAMIFIICWSAFGYVASLTVANGIN